MVNIFQILGFAGTILVAIAYLPQIAHLAKEHCSAGISVRAWLIWLLASLLIFSHAMYITDFVFIALQAVNLIAIICVLLLARRYKTGVCETHLNMSKSSASKQK